jgi:hypothetical protein
MKDLESGEAFQVLLNLGYFNGSEALLVFRLEHLISYIICQRDQAFLGIVLASHV